MISNLNSVILEGKVIHDSIIATEDSVEFTLLSVKRFKDHDCEIKINVEVFGGLSRVVASSKIIKTGKEIRVVGRLCQGKDFYILAEHIEFF